VGNTIRASAFLGSHKVYQEYPVSRVNTYYPNNSHHFDWVIPTLRLVIECHGKQHYDIVDFGGEGYDAALEAFKAGQSRDSEKREAALSAGYTYVVVPYTDSTKVSEDYLIDAISIAEEELARYNEVSEGVNVFEENDTRHEFLQEIQERQAERRKGARQRHLSSRIHLEQLEKARDYRKKRYQRWKEIKKHREE